MDKISSAIFKVEKDATWVSSVYNGGTGYNHTGGDNLVAYWKFNEGSGTTVKDYSGNDNHGTFASDILPTWSTDTP